MSETGRHHRSTPTLLISIIRWFDSEAGIEAISDDDRKVDWFRVLPLIALHAGCLLVVWVGWSPVAVITAVALYLIRMFAITGFYHRYFSHKAFKANRFWQFVFAVMGSTAVQRGPLWWAAHHRHHHRYAVSARQGFIWWELDITYYLLVLLSWLGIVRDLRPVPDKVRMG